MFHVWPIGRIWFVWVDQNVYCNLVHLVKFSVWTGPNSYNLCLYWIAENFCRRHILTISTESVLLKASAGTRIVTATQWDTQRLCNTTPTAANTIRCLNTSTRWILWQKKKNTQNALIICIKIGKDANGLGEFYKKFHIDSFNHGYSMFCRNQYRTNT